MEDALLAVRQQASEFATKITNIARLFEGPNAFEFTSELVSGRSGWLIEIHNNNEGFILSAGETEAFQVQASWTCSADHSGTWLKVERSSFGVFFAHMPNRPLFRYDFDASYTSRLPKAHIHFQSDHPGMNPSQPMQDMEHSLDRLGKGSRRARSRAKHRKQINVSDLHFPVGGTRFRPALEDILLMLVEEYGVEAYELDPADVVQVLRESLQEWRTSQARAVIRDMPSLAIDFFESKGYVIVPRQGADSPDLPVREAFEDHPDKLIGP